MGDHEQCRCAPEDAVERLTEGLGIEGGEAFVEDQELGALEQGASEVDEALLAVGELPSLGGRCWDDRGRGAG